MPKKSKKKYRAIQRKEGLPPPERKSLIIRLYDMARSHSSALVTPTQIRLILLGLLVILVTAFVAYLFAQLFYLATYRFVALFLLLILASHLLAKITRAYIRI